MRSIYITTAVQIVASESHPEGVYSAVNGYPIRRDSRDYERTEENPNGDESIALLAARADYSAEIVTLSTAENPSRVGWTVSIIRASDGKQIDLYSVGGFPDMTPAPEPEPEPEPEETPAEGEQEPEGN